MLLLQVLYKVAGTAQEIKFLVKNLSDKFQQFHLFIYLFIYLLIYSFVYLFIFFCSIETSANTLIFWTLFVFVLSNLQCLRLSNDAKTVPLPHFCSIFQWIEWVFFIMPRRCKDTHVNTFFPKTVRLWNSVPVECFLLTCSSK